MKEKNWKAINMLTLVFLERWDSSHLFEFLLLFSNFLKIL